MNASAQSGAPLLPINHAADRPLRVVLTIMAFLAALSLLGSRMAERSYLSWENELAGFATVQIIVESHDDVMPATRRAQDALNNFTVETVDPVSAKALLEPWLGDTALPEGLVLPVLLRVKTTDIAAIKNAMTPTELVFKIEDQSRWQSELLRSRRAIGWISGLLLVLITGGSMAITVFATQSAIAAESKTVSVFTQIGASDRFIGNLFVRRALRLGGVAAVLGAGLAALLTFIMSITGGIGAQSFIPHFSLSLSDIIALIILTGVLTGLGALAAGASVRQILHIVRRTA